MLRFLVYGFLFLIVTILQTVIVPRIELFGTQPNFLLILTVMAALRHGSLAGCILGFMSGLMCDVYAPVEWLGAYSLSYCIVGFTVGQINESFIDLTLLLKTAMLFVADILKDLIYYFVIRNAINDISDSLVYISIPNAFYTIALGSICFYLFSPRPEIKIEMHKQGV